MMKIKTKLTILLLVGSLTVLQAQDLANGSGDAASSALKSYQARHSNTKLGSRLQLAWSQQSCSLIMKRSKVALRAFPAKESKMKQLVSDLEALGAFSCKVRGKF